MFRTAFKTLFMIHMYNIVLRDEEKTNLHQNNTQYFSFIFFKNKINNYIHNKCNFFLPDTVEIADRLKTKKEEICIPVEKWLP